MSTKVNCSNCLRDDHTNCIDPKSCLCAESHNVKPDSRVRSAPLHYTESAMRDYIEQYIKKDKILHKTVISFRAYPNGTLLLDVSKDDTLTDLFIDKAEQLPIMVRHVILRMLQEYTKKDMKTVIHEFRHLKVVITNSLFVKMGDLGAKWQNTPVTFECLVVSMDHPKTYTKEARARCKGCFRELELTVNAYTHELQPPPRCFNEECERYKTDMDVDPHTFKTGDYRIITIQEPMEESKHGSPVLYQCEIFDDDVKNTYIGQRKKITGTFTSQITDTVNDILIKAISVLDADDKHVKVTDEDIAEFHEWLKDETFLQLRLCRSFAPEIYNETLAKLAIIISLIGGVTVGRLRGIINTLLIGDPSKGKSKILGFVPKVSPKSSYVNGATASGAGITIAYDDKIKAPRVGPVPLCHGGNVAIDEIGKVKKDDEKYLLECMEDGWIHYDKGGFDLMVPASTAIQAGENPKYDYYDKDHNIVENINLSGPIITRFDLKVNMMTDRDENTILRRYQHIDEFRDLGEDAFIKKYNLLTAEQILKYFEYAKSLSPRMSKEASALRQDFVMEITMLQHAKGDIPIDTRFYEGLYRIATAIARLHLSEIVTDKHMNLAIQIQKEALQTFYMEVEKGQTHFDTQLEATSKEGAFKHAVKETQAKAQEELVRDTKIVEEMVSRYSRFFPDEDIAWDYFEKMEQQKIILKKKGKYYLA